VISTGRGGIDKNLTLVEMVMAELAKGKGGHRMRQRWWLRLDWIGIALRAGEPESLVIFEK
jgi:hypothetical protein